MTFARAEGILPAPEPTHAIKVAIDEALAAREAGEERVILFNLSGHGHFDLSAYERHLQGTLEDYEYPAEKVEAALAALPRSADHAGPGIGERVGRPRGRSDPPRPPARVAGAPLGAHRAIMAGPVGSHPSSP